MIDELVEKYINESTEWFYVVDDKTKEVMHDLKTGGVATFDTLFNTNHSKVIAYKTRKGADNKIKNISTKSKLTVMSRSELKDYYDKMGVLSKGGS